MLGGEISKKMLVQLSDKEVAVDDSQCRMKPKEKHGVK